MKETKVVLLMLLLWASISAMGDVAAVKAVAEKEGYAFLELCLSREGAQERHRLDKDDNIANASLGEPIPLVHLPGSKVKAYRNENLKELTIWGEIYLVPVLFDGEMKLMLTIRKFSKDGPYEVAALGDGLLVKEIIKIQQKQRAASTLMLCLNPETRTFLFHLPTVDETNLTAIDLSDTKRADSYSTLSTVDNVVKVLAEKVAQRRQLW